MWHTHTRKRRRPNADLWVPSKQRLPDTLNDDGIERHARHPRNVPMRVLSVVSARRIGTVGNPLIRELDGLFQRSCVGPPHSENPWSLSPLSLKSVCAVSREIGLYRMVSRMTAMYLVALVSVAVVSTTPHSCVVIAFAPSSSTRSRPVETRTTAPFQSAAIATTTTTALHQQQQQALQPQQSQKLPSSTRRFPQWSSTSASPMMDYRYYAPHWERVTAAVAPYLPTVTSSSSSSSRSSSSSSSSRSSSGTVSSGAVAELLSLTQATTQRCGQWLESVVASSATGASMGLQSLYDILQLLVLRYWWTFPAILLCGVVPCHTLLVSKSLPMTPSFWKLVNMDFVHSMAHAVTTIALFLASNASYFGAALYLWSKSALVAQHSWWAAAPLLRPNRIPKQTSPLVSPTNQIPTNLTATLDATTTVRLPTALGGWTMAAGCMSTIFHTVQAYGDFGLAEALCYWDHGVAGTAILYFWYACGRPSVRTWACITAGLTALAFPITAVHPPLYPALHASWHVLSAVAALVWAHDAAPERLARACRPTQIPVEAIPIS
jgi:hypothetical protein